MLCAARGRIGVIAVLVVGGVGPHAADRGSPRRERVGAAGRGARRVRARTRVRRARRRDLPARRPADLDAQAHRRPRAASAAAARVDARAIIDESAGLPRAPHGLAVVGGRRHGASPARRSPGTSSTGSTTRRPAPSARSGSTACRTRSPPVTFAPDLVARRRAALHRRGDARPPRELRRHPFRLRAAVRHVRRRAARRRPGAARGLGRDGTARGELVADAARTRRARRRPRRRGGAAAPCARVAGRDRRRRAAGRGRRDLAGTTRPTRRRRSAPTLALLGGLLVLGDGCERAGLFDALAARIAVGARRLAAAAARARVRGRRRGDRRARPRRDRRAAHPGRVRRRAGARGSTPAPPCTRARTSPTRASLLLPVSNLTNLLAFRAADVSFTHFAALMVLPWAALLASSGSGCGAGSRASSRRRPDARRGARRRSRARR